ncbi:transcription factor-like protein 3 [Elsinoe australis]|uniref:Transcription factor-like protein 3 n=1 Tax=Elsinoe australis TaxID=40998 RepID=A0A4U7BAR8_9PEZI|nr:transcription factor-like protein 3 [Elsinoe australis]
MKKTFGNKRVARKIGADENEEPGTPSTGSVTAASSESETPSFVKRPSNKSRKSSSLRTSFGVHTEDTDGDTTGSGVVTPRRTNLSKVAIQRNAERRLAADVPFRTTREDSEERLSYNKSTLEELRQSTPSTPKDISPSTTDLEDERAGPARAVDLASKFGSSLSRYQAPSAIPTDAEIQEKKERRARLAKEQEYISLDANSEDEDLDENVTRDETGKLILKPKEKYPESRLVREDEDIFEDFDEFTTDGQVALGRKAEKEAEVKRRAEMAALIDQAEGQSDEAEEDDSEAERNAAFETAQTRSGTYGSRAEDVDAARPRTPPRITPLPTLDGVIGRLKARLEEMEIARVNKAQELESLRAERTQIESEEVRVQAALKDTADKFARLRESNAAKTDTIPEQNLQLSQTNGHAEEEMSGMSNRGGLGLGHGLGFGSASGPSHESSLRSTPMSVGGRSSDDSDY